MSKRPNESSWFLHHRPVLLVYFSRDLTQTLNFAFLRLLVVIPPGVVNLVRPSKGVNNTGRPTSLPSVIIGRHCCRREQRLRRSKAQCSADKKLNRPSAIGRFSFLSIGHRPASRHLNIPPPMPDIEQVTQATVLGIDITSTLSTAAYVNRMLLQINQRLYLLSQLKSQGMAVQALHQLFTGLIMSKITYALPAFAGQLTVDDRNRISAISRKALRRYCF